MPGGMGGMPNMGDFGGAPQGGGDNAGPKIDEVD